MSPLVQGKSTTSTKQNTALLPLQTSQEPSVFGKKRQIHIVLATKPHQKWRHQHITETKNTPNRITNNYATFLRSCSTILMQITVLGGDVEGVLKFAHDSKSPLIFNHSLFI